MQGLSEEEIERQPNKLPFSLFVEAFPHIIPFSFAAHLFTEESITFAYISVVLICRCPSIRLSVAIGISFARQTVVANVCRAI